MKASTGILTSLVFLATITGAPLFYFQNCKREIYGHCFFDKNNIKKEVYYSQDVWIPIHSLANFELANQLVLINSGITNKVLIDLIGERSINSRFNNERLEIVYKDGARYFRNNINDSTALGRETKQVFEEEDAFYNYARSKIWKKLNIEH